MIAEYQKALSMGQKELRACNSKGIFPYLPVLDEILEGVETCGEVDLGLVDVPVELIVGTKSSGRKRAFSRSFLPLLEEDSELASKWMSLCQAHMDEGIRDPIKVYEYLHYFYVQEGHKRVSVLRYFGAVTIPAMVTRILPERSEVLENQIYYEFLDFYQLSGLNCLWFSQKGAFERLQTAVGKAPGESWSQEERRDFFSFYLRFSAACEYKGPQEGAAAAVGDGVLLALELWGYNEIRDCTETELRSLLDKVREELAAQGKWEEESQDISMKKALQMLMQPIKAVTQPVKAMLGREEGYVPETFRQEMAQACLGGEPALDGEKSSVSAQKTDRGETDREHHEDTSHL